MWEFEDAELHMGLYSIFLRAEAWNGSGVIVCMISRNGMCMVGGTDMHIGTRRLFDAGFGYALMELYRSG